MHEKNKKGSCMQTPTFSSLALWGSARFRGYWTHDPGGMHAGMQACMHEWAMGACAMHVFGPGSGPELPEMTALG